MKAAAANAKPIFPSVGIPTVSPAKAAKPIKRVGSANQLWEEALPLNEDDEEEVAWNLKEIGSAIKAADGAEDVWKGTVGSNPVVVGQGGTDDYGMLSELDSQSSMGSSSKPKGLAYPTVSTDTGMGTNDDDSVLSGLTSLNIQTMMVAELWLEEFLKSEMEAIKKMLESEASLSPEATMHDAHSRRARPPRKDRRSVSSAKTTFG